MKVCKREAGRKYKRWGGCGDINLHSFTYFGYFFFFMESVSQISLPDSHIRPASSQAMLERHDATELQLQGGAWRTHQHTASTSSIREFCRPAILPPYVSFAGQRSIHELSTSYGLRRPAT